MAAHKRARSLSQHASRARSSSPQPLPQSVVVIADVHGNASGEGAGVTRKATARAATNATAKAGDGKSRSRSRSRARDMAAARKLKPGGHDPTPMPTVTEIRLTLAGATMLMLLIFSGMHWFAMRGRDCDELLPRHKHVRMKSMSQNKGYAATGAGAASGALAARLSPAQEHQRSHWQENQFPLFGNHITDETREAWLLDASIRDVDVKLPHEAGALTLEARALVAEVLGDLVWHGVVDHAPSAGEPAAWSPEDTVPGKYTVLIDTFRGLDKQAAFLLHRYAACEMADRVVIVWNDFSRPVPPVLTRALEALGGKARLTIQRGMNVTNRFRAQAQVRTEVVFSTNEDLLFACPLLDFAFRAAEARPDHLVGFAPRHLKENQDSFVFNWLSSMRRGSYNTVWPTKGCFMHRRAMDAFSYSPHFARARDEADKRGVGEDIAMAVAHAALFGPGKSTAVMVPRGAFRNLNVTKETARRPSKRQEDEVGFVLRQALQGLGREFIMEEEVNRRWCEPYELPPACDKEGSHDAFRSLYDWEKWWDVPLSSKPYVQV